MEHGTAGYPMKRWFLILALCLPCLGQSWSGILSPSRAIDWTKAGLPATFPDAETTPNPWTPPTRTACTTVNPSGDSSGATDTSNINTAYSGCASGHYVALAAGTFYTNSDIFFQRSNVGVKGAGACNNPSICTIINAQTNNFWLGGGGSGTSGALTASSYTAGTTTVTVASNPPTNGSIALFQQCDTGWSGSGCGTGSYSDNGAIWVCASVLTCSESSGGSSHNYEMQYVLVTGVAGNVVTFTPGLYLPNWSSTNTATLSWGGFGIGIGMEDVNIIYGRIGVNGCYACWVKGDRIISENGNDALSTANGGHLLFANNYVDSAYTASQYPVIILESSGGAGISDALFINSIVHNAIVEGGGSTQGVVFAYNYHRDAVTNDNYAGDYQHLAGDFFELREGNQWGAGRDDDTHGTHDFSQYFRNYFAGTDVPFTLTGNANAVQIGQWDRFANVIGNVIGWRQPGGVVYATSYVGTPPNLFWIDNAGGDPLTAASLMRWGNYTICSGNAHCDVSGGNWDSSEVPTSTVMPTGTYPNAGPWQNTVPSNHNLPCSFFFTGSQFTTSPCSLLPTGGTGFSWWKVVKTWTTFPTTPATTQVQPYPPIGPDITGGRTDSDGYAYDIPAAVAWKNLPIDTTFQSSYTVTASSWASTDGGTETLTISSLPACAVGNVCHLQGGFQLTTSNGAEQTPCTGGLPELLITSAGPSSSNPTTITYTLASDPGSNNCAGTFKFPDIRQFDERVYQADNASTAATPTCSANCAGTYTGSVVVTFANSNGGTTVMCGAISPTTPVTNGSGTGCSTGTNIGTGATANVTISSSETYNVVAGTSLLADSSVLSEAYTINAATTAPSRVMGLLN